MLQSILEAIVAVVFVTATMTTSALAGDGDVVVHATRDGATFAVSTEFAVAASADEVWDVLTDFDRMAQILSNVDASKILRRDGNLVQVAQTSHANAGLVRLSMDSVREVQLTPNRELHSRLLKGDVKSSEFTTRIIPEGDRTRVTVQGRFVAGGLTGAALTVDTVEKQTRRQYQELRDEILRRKAKQPPPPCLIAKTCEQGPG